MAQGTCTTAYDTASFLVRFCHEHGDTITNLHLQKYMYYSQGWFLALYDEVLFQDRIEAWVHGPAQPATYGRFKQLRWNPITDEINWPKLDDDVRSHLEEIHGAYGRFSAWDLERMTHAEAPWIDARGDIPEDEPSQAVISHESMRRYFRGRLEEDERQEEPR